MWVRSMATTGETYDLLQVPVHVAFSAATSELGLSGSGEAWGRGVPPRHCPAGEESMRGEHGAKDES